MRNIEKYLGLPYTKNVKFFKDDELYVAWIQEIPACRAHGESEEEALRNLKDSFEDWLAFAIDESLPIPIPRETEDLPSGKWVQRVARTLHKDLIDLAAEEGVSLNTLVATTLACAVGQAKEKGTHRDIQLPIVHTHHAAPYFGNLVAVQGLYATDENSRESGFHIRFAENLCASQSLLEHPHTYEVLTTSVSQGIKDHFSWKGVHRDEKDSKNKNRKIPAYA
jgi:predicted RNase H-like HicB family nuclease